MAAADPSVFEIFTIKSADGETTIDLRAGVVSFSYFEDVFSPIITATVLISSTGGVMKDEDGDSVSMYNGLPLRGGERVSIKINLVLSLILFSKFDKSSGSTKSQFQPKFLKETNLAVTTVKLSPTKLKYRPNHFFWRCYQQ